MICPRCGTEHEDPEGICPRCGHGRPKVRKPLPKWVPWSGAVLAVLLVAGAAISIFLAAHFDSSWMNGSWEGGDLSVTFNTEEGTFLLINGETVLSGKFAVSRDAFNLTTDDGKVYIYRYTRVGSSKMRLLYSSGSTTSRVIVTRVGAPAEEEAPDIEDLE